MKPDFSKGNGLLPCIVQDAATRCVLMLGYMNEEAYEKTRQEKRVTFFSRSKNRLWTKGETSGHFLEVREMILDCDGDVLLILAKPAGPVCHTGKDSCFGEVNMPRMLDRLSELIQQRRHQQDTSSYTAQLFRGGLNRIAQKTGEEAIELIIAAKDDDNNRFLEEAADLLYHFLVLLEARNVSLQDVESVLSQRHRGKTIGSGG
jgi:phosphoribosyl-ATP pyrophosphohydrolase/phosphoribosyl-AMP cyclohydrolase